MSRPLTRSAALSPAWPLPMFLLRTAWGDQPFDELTGYVSGLAESHLVEISGEPVRMLDGISPASGPTALLPGLVTGLRRSGRSHPAPESLALLTAAPGDSSSLPTVPAVRSDVAEAGWGILVRDPVSREAVCLTCVRPHPDVLRWRARGVADCPVPPQPDGPSGALFALGQAVVEAAELIERTAAQVGQVGTLDLDAHVTRLPAGLPARALELVDRIDRVEAIISVALAQPDVGADPAAREPVLRRLVAVKDAARRSAVAAAGDAALRGT
ncbi:hypothetical protein [Dietzia psychralcaliphila]|uniref:Uncharacterized protein n=1 Tax=Dietzia psychralcaliphila TaxID=139021 RepID=A0AAD0NMM9_9ACTN|nr:hypothetical protein [Dietzia psychralcaliphila]AWH95500.1 hypothetical protein A6048_08320 [Dietzia psychralcaliphila]PTM88761.1 hypothetical protein C8N39_103364 [Dietzia psychralcaliphila]